MIVLNEFFIVFQKIIYYQGDQLDLKNWLENRGMTRSFINKMWISMLSWRFQKNLTEIKYIEMLQRYLKQIKINDCSNLKKLEIQCLKKITTFWIKNF